ncbi:MAG: tRNA pseudouridine(38-40) synthase TruA [Clostridium argentinense]|uniref:tRNA pseudouridine(38-40) synthase TruA n=1 Tax=Clostridium butanoliproducens TaxID=2991837 RepID=UPI001D666EC1|nr:tRNA pseudouridine(38-40) synthase TruA [Clostridium butanoliproducens]MBS5824135.1 tRNA pseudouridine(38-40) synthase TruA [Clostridium argentinense]MDU1348614.1 tRNA pseudouridine(38-40) synthase TruA [Clostridium argentinense]
MRNLKLTIEYDGSRYKGWQRLGDNDNTIQGKIEGVLSKMTNENIELIGCGRTDGGVHAENYIANFHTNCMLSEEMMINYLYEFLPEDIVVKKIEEVEERFHARYNAKAKTYIYKINNGKFRNVFNRKYVYHIDEKLNLENMIKASKILVGTHDFQSFTTLKSKKKSTVRTINYINIDKNEDLIEIEINGDGFLWNMVRIITGTLLQVGTGKISVDEVGTILNKKKREEAGPMAQAKGLYLKEVIYKNF